MNHGQAVQFTEKFLSAWNSQEVDRVLACYTEDCSYLDPSTTEVLQGHEPFGKYLVKLFQRWTMSWKLREFFLFDDREGGAFLWNAELTPSAGGKTTHAQGMDLIIFREEKICRNEVYFDRVEMFRT